MSEQKNLGAGLQTEIRAAEALRDGILKMPGMEEFDPALIHDMVEGETHLHEMIERVVVLISETEVMIDGLDGRLTSFNARKRRYIDRKEYLRSLIEQAMVVGEIKKLELPEATLSLSHRAGGVVIIDEMQIPADYWRRPDPEVDKKRVADALKDGVKIPGATLGNGSVSLTVRRS